MAGDSLRRPIDGEGAEVAVDGGAGVLQLGEVTGR
jgi:hypothetical protein